MKHQERKAGFTKRGLFVGLAVLLVLAGLIGMLSSRLSSTVYIDRRSESAATVRNIVLALEAYNNDFGKNPPLRTPLKAGAGFILFGDPGAGAQISNRELFDVFRAIPRGANANNRLNKRQQKYFEGPKAKDSEHPHSGFADEPEFSAADQGCLFDPWGHQYCIVFTTDGSGKLDLSAIYSDLAGPERLIPKDAVVFSLGKDGILGSKKHPGRLRSPNGEPSDDIVSWQ